MSQVLGSFLCLLLLVACTLFEGPRICSAIDAPGLEVRLQDAATGEPINAPGTSVIAFRNGFVESLREFGEPGRFEGLRGREGEFDVQASSPDYLTWQESNVRLRRGDCGTMTTRLIAQMIARETG